MAIEDLERFIKNHLRMSGCQISLEPKSVIITTPDVRQGVVTVLGLKDDDNISELVKLLEGRALEFYTDKVEAGTEIRCLSVERVTKQKLQALPKEVRVTSNIRVLGARATAIGIHVRDLIT